MQFLFKDEVMVIFSNSLVFVMMVNDILLHVSTLLKEDAHKFTNGVQ